MKRFKVTWIRASTIEIDARDEDDAINRAHMTADEHWQDDEDDETIAEEICSEPTTD